MEENSDRRNHEALYWTAYFVLSILGIWPGAALLSYILTLGVKEFEGARGYAFVLLLPVIAIILLVVVIVLFVKKRNNLPVLKRILVVLLVFDVIGFGILEYLGGGIGFIIDIFHTIF